MTTKQQQKRIEDDELNDKLNGVIMGAVMPAVEFRTAYDQLRPTERAFVDAYVITDDPIEAAKMAFPVLKELPKGHDGARVRAVEYCNRPLIQAAIADKMAEISRRFELTADRVLGEIAKIAYANMDDYIDRTSGDPLLDFSPERVTREQMAAVGELTVETYKEGRGDEAREVKRIKFKLHDKLNALDKAMRRLGLYEPDGLKIIDGRVSAGPKQITRDMSADEAAELYARSIGFDDEE